MHISCVALVALAALAAATPVPNAPTADDLHKLFGATSQYTADAVMTLPYGGISEPIRIAYDGVNGMSRTDYYDGMDTYIYHANATTGGVMFQINPVTLSGSSFNVETCFLTAGAPSTPIALQSILPADFSSWSISTSTVDIRGVDCYLFTNVVTTLGRNSTYTLAVAAFNGHPVQYDMLGYDTLLGSHFDHYVLHFVDFDTSVPDPAQFAAPNQTCGDFPGPGYMSRGGLGEFEDIEKADKIVDEEFENFKKTHKKSYDDTEEHQTRKNVFRHNRRTIHSINRKQKSFKTAINHLADLTHEERKQMRGSYSSRRPGVDDTPGQPRNIDVTDLPPIVDWRNTGFISYVKDQGICGSCWSFASAEAIESAVYLNSDKTVPLSQQQLMDCSWNKGNNACDGGEAFRAYEWLVDDGIALSSEASYGVYKMADGECHYPAAGGVKISSYVNLTSGDSQNLMQTISKSGAIAIAIDAAQPSFSFYSSGVYYDPGCGNSTADLDHAVLAVGYNYNYAQPDSSYWIVKNSWSTYWGNNGYVYISQKENNCGVATDAHLPVV